MNLLNANKCRELIAELAPIITDALKPLGWMPPLFESDDGASLKMVLQRITL